MNILVELALNNPSPHIFFCLSSHSPLLSHQKKMSSFSPQIRSSASQISGVELNFSQLPKAATCNYLELLPQHRVYCHLLETLLFNCLEYCPLVSITMQSLPLWWFLTWITLIASPSPASILSAHPSCCGHSELWKMQMAPARPKILCWRYHPLSIPLDVYSQVLWTNSPQPSWCK